MTHTRWKLLAGCFGIAVCGLGALAGASRKLPLAMGCDYRPMVMDEQQQVAAVIPVQPVRMGAVEKKLREDATKPPVVLVPTIPQAASSVSSIPIELLNVVGEIKPPVLVSPPTLPSTQSLVLPGVLQGVPENHVPPMPAVEVKIMKSAEAKVAIPEYVQIPGATPVPALESIPEITLTMKMAGGLPTVELRSRSGAFLMISCEQIDIAARGPKDDLPSSIKASGKVKFSASGCQGTCDELVFNPKSMEGTLRNAVKLQCSQGGPITELTADQIAFQLRPDSKEQFSIFSESKPR